LIRDKLTAKCEEVGVRVVFQTSTYRSQRCFQCGWVRKVNRKGKVFECKNCGHLIDADLNAAQNHSITLPDVPNTFRNHKLNVVGFFWKPSGFFNYDGKELTVPASIKEKVC
jgi:predicted nucleic acid-binding Zn ribbon protein